MADADRTEFLRRYGGIYEHSPWVAEQAYAEAKGIKDPDRLARIFARHVEAAGPNKQLALIRAHPDLAGKAAVGARTTGDHPSDELTEASQEEQQSAGIDQCTPEEYNRFQDYNHRYKKKFGFPFIMAVRNSNRHEILKAFEQRLHNDPATEFTMALTEIHKIANLRFHAVGARTTGDRQIESTAPRRP